MAHPVPRRGKEADEKRRRHVTVHAGTRRRGLQVRPENFDSTGSDSLAGNSLLRSKNSADSASVKYPGRSAPRSTAASYTEDRSQGGDRGRKSRSGGNPFLGSGRK